MERQLLTIFFIVISVFGCQQTPTTIKDIPKRISNPPKILEVRGEVFSF